MTRRWLCAFYVCLLSSLYGCGTASARVKSFVTGKVVDKNWNPISQIPVCAKVADVRPPTEVNLSSPRQALTKSDGTFHVWDGQGYTVFFLFYCIAIDRPPYPEHVEFYSMWEGAWKHRKFTLDKRSCVRREEGWQVDLGTIMLETSSAPATLNAGN